MSKRLFVGNLPYQVDDAALLAAFQSQGFEVASARVVLDRDTGRSRGFAFVDFDSDEAAKSAMDAMNGVEIQGRQMRVTEAEDRRPPRPSTGGPGFGGPRPRPGGPRSDGPRFSGGGRPMRRRDEDDRRRSEREFGGKRRKGRDRVDDDEPRRGGGFDYDDDY
ncbi:MAG TPA: RNA-binding protein [Planctomycetota bacterium]|nr:RNA-binding protein [Planctomycetota bacterium]